MGFYKSRLSSKLLMKEVILIFNFSYFFSIIVTRMFQFDLSLYFHTEHIPNIHF